MIMYAIFGMLAVIVGIMIANVQKRNGKVRAKTATVIVSRKEDKTEGDDYEHWSCKKIVFTIVILAIWIALAVLFIVYMHNSGVVNNIPVQN